MYTAIAALCILLTFGLLVLGMVSPFFLVAALIVFLVGLSAFRAAMRRHHSTS